MDGKNWLPILLVLPSFISRSMAAADHVFDLKLVVEGVYAAIPRPQHVNNSNAAIILLDDGVLVVDTHWKPSAAQALIAQIRTLTNKPVRFVVNTHFHWDHYQGNQAYPSAWPAGLEIIASQATRESIELRGIPHVKRELATLPQGIEKLKVDLVKAADATQREEIQENLRQAEEYLAELRTMQVTLPTLTFDSSLILHRLSRNVEILWLGKAHTDGDVFVYLPKEKVIATGDVLSPCAPYLGDSYPYDWIETLDRAEKLDFDYVIGGHGEVLRGKGQFELFKQYLRDLLAETAEAYAQGATLNEARKRIAPQLAGKYANKFPGGPPLGGVRPPCPWPFSEIVVGNIGKAYRVASGVTE